MGIASIPLDRFRLQLCLFGISLITAFRLGVRSRKIHLYIGLNVNIHAKLLKM